MSAADCPAPKLGKLERQTLRLLVDLGGEWWPGCGWVYGSRAETARTLDVLKARGLVTRGPGPRWRVTEAGRTVRGAA